MPVCLNCGKEIEGKTGLCADCEKATKDRAAEMLDLPVTKWKRPRYHDRLWLFLFTLIFVAVVVFVVVALISMVPTSKKFVSQTQADICHNNLTQLLKAVDNYNKQTHQYPSTGHINKANPLMVDGYVNAVPHCPSTGHEYIIKDVNGKYTVVCDSGLPGHTL